MFEKHLNLFENYPAWFPKLAGVPDFGAATWPQWAEIAWQVLEGISPNGRPHEHPAFHSSDTKICNVRKGAGNDGATARADIRQALFDGMETIATGVSPRTRQRENKGYPTNLIMPGKGPRRGCVFRCVRNANKIQ